MPMNTGPSDERLVALGAFGALLLSYPILSLFNVPRLVLGIPLLHAYLFAVWAGFIALTALALDTRPK